MHDSVLGPFVLILLFILAVELWKLCRVRICRFLGIPTHEEAALHGGPGNPHANRRRLRETLETEAERIHSLLAESHELDGP
ncbi:uncharacterized protein B0H18DRAFT_1015618 [Fomitopsis serialis]|uniref:uncharacterized protein n=1 Tax=Fomitopsis serialis TaxID=139415 RepID=UPI0020082CB0|nr:uncharacterized protein B0H18DRAFT_1015618 [Neoantrodia serialis]KAH9923286.1 hypothetical protein B0H18DRAFT_1015618 [Neoantrodia serialis]